MGGMAIDKIPYIRAYQKVRVGKRRLTIKSQAFFIKKL